MNRLSVLKLYQDVIEDVISGVRDLFTEDGVDDQVLQELRQTWEHKLQASKAVDTQSDMDKGQKKVEFVNGIPKQVQPSVMKQVVGHVAPNNHVQTQPIAQVIETKMVPIQITLPTQPGSDAAPRVLTIQVPATALQGNQLHKVLTGPVITATMGLPQNIASSVLQQHVNAAFTQQTVNIVSKTVIQGDGALDEDDDVLMSCSPNEYQITSPSSDLSQVNSAAPFSLDPSFPGPSPSSPGPSPNSLATFSIKRIKQKANLARQEDGPADTSEEEDDVSDDDDVSDEPEDDKDDEDPEMEAEGPEEEPLNSEDDVSEEDPSELFDTENVVVCQYDKITRSRNKWKFHLKDGIMNLNGEDYVFQKASGDAEW